MVFRKFQGVFFLSILILLSIEMTALSADEEQQLSAFDNQVKAWAESCRDEVVNQLNLLVTSERLSLYLLFDTFYIPVPNTDPQKYNTQYDKYTDEVLQPVLDKYLKKNKKLIYVVAVDINGYLPTHNTQYATKSKDSPNLTKRLFNDKSGLRAARNKEPYLLQTYVWVNGETISDLSIPIYLDEKHWGALRIGYSLNETKKDTKKKPSQKKADDEKTHHNREGT